MSVEEPGEVLELIDAMVQNSIDFWRKSVQDCAEYYVDAYRCVQVNIKAITEKVQSSEGTAK